MDDVPRLRVFAGPNGSGKSTLKENLKPEWLGYYLNADEIQRAMTAEGYDVSDLPFTVRHSEIAQFWAEATILSQSERSTVPDLKDGRISTRSSQASYGAAVISDFLRQRLLTARATFSFETVMSHESKVSLLLEAKSLGYRTYLYFICTDDPEINVARVAARVNTGGHSVPEDKIRKRYFRTLELLPKAIQAVDRAYIFDNSKEDVDRVWIGEFTDGATFMPKVELNEMPAWVVEHLLRYLR